MITILTYFENNKPDTYKFGPYVLIQNPFNPCFYRIEKKSDDFPFPCVDVTLDSRYCGFMPYKQASKLCEELNKGINEGEQQ